MTRRLPYLRTLRVIVAGALAALTVTSFALAADGDLDPSFDTDGSVVLDPLRPERGFFETNPVAAEDPQGRVVVAQLHDLGEGAGLSVWRLNKDGSRDTSFNDGAATEIWTHGGSSGVEAVRVVDGKIYVVQGYLGRGFVLFRLLDDGTLDASLDSPDDDFEPGVLDLGEIGRACYPVAADIASTGRIDAVWACMKGGRAVIRTFDEDGNQIGSPETIGDLGSRRVVDAAINESGAVRVLINGWDDNDDTRFWVYDRTGLVASGPGRAEAVDVAADDAFVVAGTVWNEFKETGWEVRRFTPAGALDPGFGTDGTTVVWDDRLGWVNPGGPGIRHVTLGADGQVIVVGDERETESSNGRGTSTVRLHPNGAPNTSWGPGGVKVFSPPAPPEVIDFSLGGPALLLADGRVVLPIAVPPVFPPMDEARGAGGSPLHVRVFRLGEPRPAPQPPSQEQQSAPQPTPVTASTPSRAPQVARTCLSRRSFSIRVRPKGRKLVSATVKVAGKKVKVQRRNGRLTAAIDLKKLKQGAFTVSVVAKDAKGRTYRDRRMYRTCRVGQGGPKVKGGSTVITVGG